MYYTYLYIDPNTDIPFYIGKGTRYRAWAKEYRNKAVLGRIRNLMDSGTPHEVVIMECSSEENAFALEKGLIKILGRKNLGNGPLLNMSDGGEGNSGMVVSEHTRMKRSSLFKGHLNVGKAWINNGLTEKRFNGTPLPQGYVPGRLKSIGEKISNTKSTKK